MGFHILLVGFEKVSWELEFCLKYEGNFARIVLFIMLRKVGEKLYRYSTNWINMNPVF